MKITTRVAILALFIATFSPSVASASMLTTPQIEAVISLLQAFGADSDTVYNVRMTLENSPSQTQEPAAPQVPLEKVIPTDDSALKYHKA